MASEVGKGAAEIGVGELYDQVIQRIELENALSGGRGATARRIFNALFDLVRVRLRKGLPPYPDHVVRDVAWILVRNH